MIQTSQRKLRARFPGRRALAPLAGALLVLAVAGEARASAEEVPQGRLGYRWVEPPPSRPMTDADRLGLDIAKFGGGSLVAVWLLRKMFSAE